MGRRTLLLIASILVAAIGTGLILLWVKDANNRVLEGTRTENVVVASQDIPAGQTIAQSKTFFTTKDVPVQYAVGNPYQGPSGLAELRARTGSAVAFIPQGHAIIETDFAGPETAAQTGATAGNIAIQLQLSDPFRVAGLVVPGSTVAVIDTSTGKSQPKSQYLLAGITVLRVGSIAQAAASTATATETVPNQILTLSVSTEEALALRYAEKNGGDLSLILQGGTAIDLQKIKPATQLDVVPSP